MARLARDQRGAIYVEFLLAFLPVFILFLGICQLALIASARLIVQHAALSAVRSAIVVLEESPDDFGGVERGWVSKGQPGEATGVERVIAALGLGSVTGSSSNGSGVSIIPQQGARMAPIRTSAYIPLLALAPRANEITAPRDGSIASSLPGGFARRIAFASEYTRSASVVTVHAQAGSDNLPAEPIDPKGAVTVRVTYLYPCSIPVVRVLTCKTVHSLLGAQGKTVYGLSVGAGNSHLRKRFELSEARGELEQLVAPDARFVVLTGEATLPNQGAAYTRVEAE